MVFGSDSDILEEPWDTMLPPIVSRYLLVINVPLYRDKGGDIYAGELWFKDLAEHLCYLENFTLACPILADPTDELAIPLSSDPRFSRIAIAELPTPRSVVGAIRGLPRTAWRLLRAVRSADIIHASIAGWPVPYGWVVAPMAKLFGKKLVIVVESAPWRLSVGLSQNLKARITASVYEHLARWCLRCADLAIFTQDEYRRSMLARKSDRGHVIHASWIDARVILSDARAGAIWDEKLVGLAGKLSILFVGRLESNKGIGILLDAIKVVAGDNIPVVLGILGSGELAARCREVSAELRGPTRVVVLGTVAYGAPLFELLQRYHAIVLPSISDEQPRVVYDAYSQALPVIASATAGMRDCIQENKTGWLIGPSNVESVSTAIKRAAENIGELRRMGMDALVVARSMTHQRMHLERQRLLLELTQPIPGCAKPE